MSQLAAAVSNPHYEDAGSAGSRARDLELNLLHVKTLDTAQFELASGVQQLTYWRVTAQSPATLSQEDALWYLRFMMCAVCL